MDTYAQAIAGLTATIGRKDAMHIGHSTAGREVNRYVAKFGKGRVIESARFTTHRYQARRPWREE